MFVLKRVLGLIIYKITPVKQGVFYFTSFNGHYSDNTRYISEKLHEIYPNVKIVWGLLPEYMNNAPDYIIKVRYNSLKDYFAKGIAQAHIDNVYGFRAHFLFSKNAPDIFKYYIFNWLSYKHNQPIFATMHGTSFKKIGRAQIGNTVYACSCKNTHLIVGDSFTEKALNYITFNQCIMKTVGWPRNDILFSDNDLLRNRLNLPNNKKIILFAPTFRNDGFDTEGKNIYRSGLNQLELIDFDLLFETLNQKFGGEWVMVCRFHYHVLNLVNWEALNDLYPNRFINGNLSDDMSEYLACADVLLTDTSSCMFDFANTEKPCFLFFPDYTHYRDVERGFYYDINQLPFPFSKTFDELLSNINNFDLNEYKSGCSFLLRKIGSFDDGHSAERAVNYIMEHL